VNTSGKEPLAYKLVRACEWMAIHDIERVDREDTRVALNRAHAAAHAEWQASRTDRRQKQARTAWCPAPFGSK
jgi:hypothetical protein